MQIKEIKTPLWVDRLVEFDANMDPQWLCDRHAVRLSNDVGPRRDAVKLYLRRERTTVAAAVEGKTIIGYVIGDDDRETKPKLGGRGGCRGRWMSIAPTDDADAAKLMQGMFDFLADRYGWIWGRITNPLIRDTILEFGCEPVPGEPTVFTYRKLD